MRRRLFLRHLSATGTFFALAPFGLLGRSIAATDRNTATIAARAGEIFQHPDGARTIGRAYLASCSPRPLKRRLVADLTTRLGRDLHAVDSETLRRRLARQVRKDMADDRTIVVNGWVLADTEARVCALLAMS